MPLAPTPGPIVLRGVPLTPPPLAGPHKPNLAIQARLAPELIAAITEARKKGLQLYFEAYGPNAGFHIDGQHFPLTSVTAERTPHEIYAYDQLPQPALQVVGKVAGRCTVQRTLTEEDQEKLRQSRCNAETNRDRTIGRIGVPDAPAKPSEKKKPPVRKAGVITASTVSSLRQSPAPGTAGNSPPPGAPSRPTALDGPPNPFQVLLIHHLAYAPTTLKQLAATLKRQTKEIRPCLDSIATCDEPATGPRPDAPNWTLKPTSYQYLRLTAPGAANGGHWLTLTPDDIKRITADANRAFDELKLPSDAPARLALAPAPPSAPQPTSQPTPPATSAKPGEISTPKHHPLPARPTAAAAAATATNGRLDVPKPSRVPSPATVPDASSREMSVDIPRAPPVRPPVRVTTKEKPKATDDSEPMKDITHTKRPGSTGVKSKTGANGKDKTKVKSKPIITADSDGEDFVNRDRERKPPPPPPVVPIAAPSPVPTPTPPIRPPTTSLHSRATSSSSSKHPAESASGAKRPKRDADVTLDDLERELDSGYAETSKSVAPVVTTVTKPALEGKKRRMNEDDPRIRERDRERDKVKGDAKKKTVDKDKPKVKTKVQAVGTPVKVERAAAKEPGEKRKRREADQDSDASFDLEVKKKRRVDPSNLAPPKREKLPRDRERESESSAVEARPKKPLPTRKPDGAPRVKEKIRKLPEGATGKTNGAAVAAAGGSNNTTAAIAKVNGSSKKDRAMYTSSEDEDAPTPAPARRRPAAAQPPARVVKPPPAVISAPSPSDASTPRERERNGIENKTETDANLPLRERYSEVYRDYANMNARLADERFKVQKLLKDLDEGDHDSLDTTLVESLTKAYREAHEELVALRERLAVST
ncbi:Microtubule-associated protein 1B [Rhizoctonia solani]|uniref:Microtubule-associated protein 1B n=1 Tax=Rhizoctonia solani TaxID=456999 RepID=A0A0K6FLM2_9AGAM|nr:Microtubule-associated protein 1B [Rhizoctonia solani]